MPAEITRAGAKTGPRVFISICRYLVAAAAIVLLVTLTVNGATAYAAAQSGIAPYIERELRDQPNELRAFYADREFRAVWNDPKRRAELTTLEQLARVHGLEPASYSLVGLHDTAALLDERSAPASLAALDVRASAAILRLAVHLRDGAVDMASWRTAAPRDDAQIWAANALGQLKFEMPNPYFIYLHDTPSRQLFANDSRAFSSGCIRLENPQELARLLMAREADAAVARLDRALTSQRTRHLELDDPIPVVVMYGTVDIDTEGRLVFARDVYGRDNAVLTAMNSSQPDDKDTIMLASVGPAAR